MREVHPVASSPKYYWPYSLVVGITRLTGRGTSAGTGIVADPEVHDDGGSAERGRDDRQTGTFADAECIALVFLATHQGCFETVAVATLFAGIEIHAEIDRIDTIRRSPGLADTMIADIEHCTGLTGTSHATEGSDRKRVAIAEVSETGWHVGRRSRSRRRVMRAVAAIVAAMMTARVMLGQSRRSEQSNRRSDESQFFHDHSLLLVTQDWALVSDTETFNKRTDNDVCTVTAPMAPHQYPKLLEH